jgi:flagellum-specific peptidoglycan hydrolase FlgJ
MGKKYFSFSYWRSSIDKRIQFKTISKRAYTFINIKYLLFFIILIILSGCGSIRKINNRKVSNLKNTRSTQRLKNLSKKEIALRRKSSSEKANDYIVKFSTVAKEEMKKFKIPASITLAQGMLESGLGYGTLAKKANNHFGIKCHKGWKGKKIYHDDDKKGECFRVYKNAKKSYRDHSLFLSRRGRYSFLFDYKTNNYKAWARGLKKAGYATDPKYPQKLIDLIERYQLYRFDKRRFFSKDNKSKKITYYKVKKGDTLYSISKKYDIPVKELVKNNNLKNNTIYLGQELNLKTQN